LPQAGSLNVHDMLMSTTPNVLNHQGYQ